MNVICFHKPNEVNGFLSNWYKSSFILDGVKFSSEEQHMMYSKAVLFKDTEVAAKILQTEDPAAIKALGRMVKNYDDAIWCARSYEIVKRGLYAKFSQNPRLRKKLLSTGNLLLAECAVNDRKWGIGVSMNDPRNQIPQCWRGSNLLGQVLMDVRAML